MYLPAGADWFDLATDTLLHGGQEIEASAPLDRIPVFVRAGSIVPMGPDRAHADEAPDGLLEVHVYPGRDTTFNLYDDAGDGYGYEAGEFATVELAWDEAARSLTIGQRVGQYPGMPQERDVVVVLHGGLDASTRDALVGPRRLCYAGARVAVQL